MTGIENGTTHVLCVPGLGSDGHDPFIRAARRVAGRSPGLKAHSPFPHEIFDGDNTAPPYVVVPPLCVQGRRIAAFTERSWMPRVSKVVGHSLALSSIAHAGLDLSGVQLVGVASGLTPSEGRIRQALVPPSDMTREEQRAIQHYEGEFGGSAVGVLRFPGQPSVLVSEAFMADATAHPEDRLVPFLQAAVEQNPDPGNHPRLVLLKNDDRLGDQLEEVAALQAAVPELRVVHYGDTNDHYLRHPAHAAAVVGGVMLGNLLEI